MTDTDALLDAIFANPGDDTPRLVYADWLEEHGHPEYADFIRLCCRAEGEPSWDVRYQLNRERHERIIRLHRDWRLREARFLPAEPTHAFYPRGVFEGRVEVSAFEFLAAADMWHPLIHPRDLSIRGFNEPDQPARLAAHPRLAAVRRLQLGTLNPATPMHTPGPYDGLIDPGAVLAVVRSPRLVQLEQLTIGPVVGSRAFLTAFGETPAVRGLDGRRNSLRARVRLDARGPDLDIRNDAWRIADHLAQFMAEFADHLNP